MHGGRKVAIEKLDKHTWRAASCRGPLEVACEIYAWDLSVRSAYLDQTQGFFNGTSVFLLPIGREHEACSVDILPPAAAAKWRVITGLAPERGVRRLGFGTYRARDYDELIDCPVQMGEFVHVRFDVLGVPHELAVTGPVPKLDMDRLAADLARVCEQQIRLFEPRRRKAPFERYSFMTLAVGEGYGGLEHRNSTALICRRDDLPFAGMKDATEGYRNFLGLASHEYFHSWNVKRIRPDAFVPYDLTQENYTRLLWAFEGFTSYYDDLLLARAGLLTPTQYLETLGKTMTTVMQRIGAAQAERGRKLVRCLDQVLPPGRERAEQRRQLLPEGRADRPGARLGDPRRNSRPPFTRRRDAPAVAAIQARRSDYRGVGEDEFIVAAEQATGLVLAPLVREWTEGTRDPDFARLLKPFGIEVLQRPAVDSAAFALLGVQLASGADCRLAHVHDGTPAQAAGLSAGDVVIAVDGLRVTPGNLDKLLLRYAPGDRFELAAFRRDELMHFDVALAQRPPLKTTLVMDPGATAAAIRLRKGWLGQA